MPIIRVQEGGLVWLQYELNDLKTESKEVCDYLISDNVLEHLCFQAIEEGNYEKRKWLKEMQNEVDTATRKLWGVPAQDSISQFLADQRWIQRNKIRKAE